MRLATILLMLCATSAAAQVGDTQPATTNGAPWQVQIYSNAPPDAYTPAERAAKPYWELSHRCGGSLIAPGWVLTAAHCIDRQKVAKGYRVRLGTLDLARSDGVTYVIDRMVQHRGYDEERHLNDIALVHFVADRATVQPARLRVEAIRLNGRAATDRSLGAGEAVTALGWGRTAAGASAHDSAQLIQVEVKTVDCAAAPAYRGRTTADMLCAAAPGRDTCQNDSGGPLIRTLGKPVLVGIISWGDGCADPERPGVYVRIDAKHYLDWIDRAMAAAPSVDRID